MLLNWVTALWVSFTILCSSGVWTAAWHACGGQVPNLEWFSTEAAGCEEMDEGSDCSHCCSNGVITVAPASGVFHSAVTTFIPLPEVPDFKVERPEILIAGVAKYKRILISQGFPPGRGRPLDFLPLISVFRI